MKLAKRVLAKKNATRSLPGIGISFCFLHAKMKFSGLGDSLCKWQ